MGGVVKRGSRVHSDELVVRLGKSLQESLGILSESPTFHDSLFCFFREGARGEHLNVTFVHRVRRKPICQDHSTVLGRNLASLRSDRSHISDTDKEHVTLAGSARLPRFLRDEWGPIFDEDGFHHKVIFVGGFCSKGASTDPNQRLVYVYFEACRSVQGHCPCVDLLVDGQGVDAAMYVLHLTITSVISEKSKTDAVDGLLVLGVE